MSRGGPDRDLGPLRLMMISDGRGDADRLELLVERAVRGGLRCVQLREPRLSARECAALCERLRALLAPVDGLLLVNDRVDVAAAGCADGAHVGYRSLRPSAARRALGPDRLLGMSTHDPDELAEAAAAGCDYALLSPVWPTPSKPHVVPLGLERAGAWTERAPLPVLWLGGVTAAAARELATLPDAQRPVGLAAMRAMAAALDVTAATATLCRALDAALPTGRGTGSRG